MAVTRSWTAAGAAPVLVRVKRSAPALGVVWLGLASRSEEHTSELQSHRDLHSFPTRRSSDLHGGDAQLDRRRRGPGAGAREAERAGSWRRLAWIGVQIGRASCRERV